MASFSTYLASLVARFMFNNNAGSLASPGDSLYVALFTAATGLEANSPSAELSGDAYARVQVEAAGWTDADGVVTNDAEIEFPQATGDWGTVTHAAVMDASTSGNVLYWGALTAPREVLDEDIVTLAAGEFSISHL